MSGVANRPPSRGLFVDGNFGSASRAAAVAFQRSKGLTQDGVVGSQTWAALI